MGFLDKIFGKNDETKEIPVAEPLAEDIPELKPLPEAETSGETFRRQVSEFLKTLAHEPEWRVDQGNFIGIVVDGYEKDAEGRTDLEKLLQYFTALGYVNDGESDNTTDEIHFTPERPGSWRFLLRFYLRPEHSTEA